MNLKSHLSLAVVSVVITVPSRVVILERSQRGKKKCLFVVPFTFPSV